MLDIKMQKHSIRGSLARQLLRIASRIPGIINGEDVDFGRLYTNRLTDSFKYPRKITNEWIDVGKARMEKIAYRDQKAKYCILQLHGGAYVYGYNDTYRRSALKYLHMHDEIAVFSLDYRLAPKNPYPAALEDAYAAYLRLIESGFSPESIILVGDSAGGGLALALGLYLRDNGLALPRAIVTMSAWTDLAAEGESYVRNKSLDPYLGETLKSLDVHAYAGNHDLHDPYISPAYANYHGFTDLMMHVGSYEVIESDTITVAKKADDAGNDVEVTIYNGMFHVFQLAFGLIPEARKAWKEIRKYIRSRFGSIQ